MALPQTSVTYLLREGADGLEVLLRRSGSGVFGRLGLLDGLCGALHPGEHPRLAAVREIEGQAGLFVEPGELRHAGFLSCRFPSDSSRSEETWVYLARTWIGDVAETSGTWFAVERLPLAEMRSDARCWLGRALGGAFIRASFEFDESATAVASDDPASGLPPLRGC